MKKHVILLCLFLTTLQGIAQSGEPDEFPVLRNQVGGSPNSAAMAKYTNGSESLATGALTVTIPVTSIQSHQLGVPLVLNYISNGIRVNEVPSWVGLGWSLMAGGVITRQMNGQPDEDWNAFLDNAQLATDPNPEVNYSLVKKQQLAAGNEDMMPDKFSIASSFISGSFSFDNNGVAMLLPASDVRIETFFETTGGDNTIHLTLPNGVKLIFGGNGATEDSNVGFKGPDPDPYTSAWYLKYAISADKMDTITFNYSSFNYTYPTITNYTKLVYWDYQYINAYEQQQDITYTIDMAKYLDEIVFSHGKVEFVHSNQGNYGGRQLDQIKVYSLGQINSTYQLKDTYTFNYQTISSRPFLTSFARENTPAYTFSYIDKSLPLFGSKDQDHWGYYNGAGNTDFYPALNLQYITTSGSREPDFEYTDSGLLASVTSPLGAKTTYHMEQNSVGMNGEVHPYGGLRLAFKELYDPISGIEKVITYSYLDPVTQKTSGRLLQSFGYVSSHDVKDANPPYDYNCTMVMALQPTIGSNPGSPVMYEHVTVFESHDATFRGKTENRFRVVSSGGGSYPYLAASDPSWQRGQLMEQTVYKYDNGFKKISHTINDYSFGEIEATILGQKAFYNKILLNGAAVTSSDISITSFTTEVGFPHLTKTTVNTFDPTNELQSISKETDYTFGSSNHHFPTQIKSMDSQGREILLEKTYVKDAPATGINALLQNENIIATPLETKTILNAGTRKLLAISKMEFLNLPVGVNNRLYPDRIYTTSFENPLEESQFSWNGIDYQKFEYDSWGHVVSSSISNGSSSAVLFEGEGRYPVARVSNAGLNEVAYTGFEFNDHAGWVVSGSTVNTSKSKSGIHSYDLSQGNITKSNIPGGRFLVSVWANAGIPVVKLNAVTQNLIQGETLVLNGISWTHYYVLVDIVSSGQVQLSGSATIDDLRLFPNGAFMITSTYDDLGRLSSTTSEDNQTTYTEYDNRNQVHLIRDKDRNIIRQYTSEFANE